MGTPPTRFRSRRRLNCWQDDLRGGKAVTIETDVVQPGALPPPPVAPRRPTTRELHGESVVDDYGWMRDPQEAAFHDYLVAERAYYDAHTRHLSDLADRLADEALG